MLPWCNRSSSVAYLTFRPEYDWRAGRPANTKQLHRLWRYADHQSLKAGDLVRFYSLYGNLAACVRRKVPGALAELGVYKGTMARIMREIAPEREMYLFDTFEGYSAADIAGDPFSGQYGAIANAYGGVTVDEVRRHVGSDRVNIMPGHFPESAESISPAVRFAFVHLDADIYLPTRSGLEFFYPRMTPGGMILIHDYNSELWPGVSKAVDEFMANKPETPVIMPDAAGSCIIAILSKNA